MAIELARAHTVAKPWGIADLRPWSAAGRDDSQIGEIRYERSSNTDTDPSLLLKLLFTKQALSIQVHPDDAYARSIGLPHGKTEAWYVLNATPQAMVALGLKQRLTPQQLRQAVDEGSIADLVAWRAVSRGETILVPAGTIHTIGAGLVIAEIQQRSDTTFRLFDQGRDRELHIDDAIAAADAGPAGPHALPMPTRISDARTLLVANPHFTLEKIDLPRDSHWRLIAKQETWLLVIDGTGNAGSLDVVAGDAVFAETDEADIIAGPAGMTCIVAYASAHPAMDLLERQPSARTATPQRAEAPTSLSKDKTAAISGRIGMTQ